MGTDAEWEKWGKQDPYFGVFTHEKFRNKNLTEETKNEFFESGRIRIGHVLDVCRRHFDQDFAPKRVLDFGCGTGRLVIPLADIAEYVVGLDVSDAMLQEARKNCDARSVSNVSLRKSDDDLSSLDGPFDLIHSDIVFQHLPVERGRHIFATLLNYLDEGGMGAVQFTYAKAQFGMNYGVPPADSRLTKLRKSTQKWRRRLKRSVQRLLGIKPPSQDPELQMNPYNVDELLFLMQSAGIQNVYLEFTDHGGEWGISTYFQKPRRS